MAGQQQGIAAPLRQRGMAISTVPSRARSAGSIASALSAVATMRRSVGRRASSRPCATSFRRSTWRNSNVPLAARAMSAPATSSRGSAAARASSITHSPAARAEAW
jgi:hypothetical protein